jgi:hypothetical protein
MSRRCTPHGGVVALQAYVHLQVADPDDFDIRNPYCGSTFGASSIFVTGGGLHLPVSASLLGA